jgi:4-hydroxy-3-methylbut-2-enyl diphosphate reductase
VENAIEISYRALEESVGKKVYLLSQMIHNQEVNEDLVSRGIKFIMDTDGSQFIPWEENNKRMMLLLYRHLAPRWKLNTCCLIKE